MIKILTPLLPLPYKGGEQLPPCLTQGFREALPSLQGEGQGWGLYLYSFVPSYFFIITKKHTC